MPTLSPTTSRHLLCPGRGSFGWFENLDGAGTFGPFQSFVDHLVIDMDSVDLDYDGDLDIVQASDEEPWGIEWHENTDGTGAFGQPQTISDARAWSVAALDMDADADSDLLVGIVGEGSRLALFENTSNDCNTNSVPDSCDIGSGTSQDCDTDGVPDECGDDCNGNGMADSCDVASQTSDDCNADGIPDECEPDCNRNDVADECDVTAETSNDCNADGVPDECESDCNDNGVADDCDVTGGTDQDCDENGVLDSCEITAGTVQDCNDNGVPDTCDGDCNGNGLADSCDIASGLLEDCNANDIPDVCETEVVFFARLIDADVVADAVVSADVDGDGDLDVVSGAGALGIGWYENLDGAGGFGSRQSIDGSFAVYTETLDVADADGDGDVDIFAVKQDQMVWYENLDGLGLLGPKQIINTTPGPPAVLVAADIDGDLDNDLVRSPHMGNDILWFENLDGQGSFAAGQVVDGGLWRVPSLFVTDIDGDTDNDLLAGLTGSGEGIVWYENQDGDGSFGSANFVSTAIRPESVLATDVDGDGDNDVVGALWQDNRIVWHENLDGSGVFGPERIISTAASRAVSVFAADIAHPGATSVVYDSPGGTGSLGSDSAGQPRTGVSCP